MMLIEKRLGELEQENTEKKDTIVVLDSTNKTLECNIKDKESTVNILSEEIDNLKKQMRYFFYSFAQRPLSVNNNFVGTWKLRLLLKKAY